MEKEKAKTVQWQSLSWSLFVILIQRYHLTILNGNLKCSYFQWVDMGLFNRIRPDPGFVRLIRSNPGCVSPIRSTFCQRPYQDIFLSKEATNFYAKVQMIKSLRCQNQILHMGSRHFTGFPNSRFNSSVTSKCQWCLKVSEDCSWF